VIGAANLPRITLGKEQAADALGVSLDTFERRVWPDLRVISCGGRKLVRVGELERWAREHEAFAPMTDSA
jgi:hypothetical protein